MKPYLLDHQRIDRAGMAEPFAFSRGTAVVRRESQGRLSNVPDYPDRVRRHLLQSDVHAAGPALAGHRQTTDAYLVSLAVSRGGVLATFDRGMKPLARRNPGYIEIVM